MRKRVIVVGAGIIGASIAYHLQKAGASVVVVAEKAEGVATPQSFAWINASWGNPTPYVHFRMRSMEAWRRCVVGLPQLPVNWCGSVLYDLPKQGLEDYQRDHAALGYDVQLASEVDVRRLEPFLKQAPELAVVSRREGMVEPAAAARVFLQAAQAMGAEVVCASVKSLGVDASVETETGSIQADDIVLAAGLGAVPLLQAHGVDLAVDAVPGLLATTQTIPKVLNGLVLSEQFHVRQKPDGSLLIGSDFSGNLRSTPVEDAEKLVALVNDALELTDTLRLASFTVGERPSPRDGLPFIGRIKILPKIIVAVMHSGITLAPLVGEAVAALVQGRDFEGLNMFAIEGRCAIRA